MKVEGTYTFDAPQKIVWPTILDPEVLARTLPGVQELKLVGENEYQATMKIRIGPVQGVFSGSVQLTELKDPESCHLHVDGKGAPGFVRGEGDLKLTADGDSTILSYQGDAQVGGRLASVGQRLMESSTQALIRQSLESLDSQVTAKVSGDESQVFEPAAPPTELQFAAGVTKKMIEDMIPADQRQNLIKGIAASLFIFIVLRTMVNWWTDRLANRVADILEERSSLS